MNYRMSKKKDDIRWDLTPLYKSDDDPQMKTDRVKATKNVEAFVKKWKKNKEYTKSPEVMLEALEDNQSLFDKNNSGYYEIYYLSKRLAQKSSNPALIAKYNDYDVYMTELANKMTFFGLSIKRIPKDKQKKFLDYKGLQKFKHYLEKTFEEGKYMLSEKEEQLLNILGKNASSNWTMMLKEFLSKYQTEGLNEKGEKEKLTLTQFFNLLESPDQKVRDEAGKQIHAINEHFSDVAEKEFNNNLEYSRKIDKLRGYSRPDQERHIADDIDSEVVDAMVQAVTDNFDISQEYYQAYSKALGKKKLKYHERHIPMSSSPMKFSYREGFDLVDSVFRKLDMEFSDIIRSYDKNRQVDVIPRKGKRGGAFCSGYTKDVPTYILLNHAGSLNNVLTIAHEFGHGINNELMKEQEEFNFATPLSTAEVASTFFEGFVLEELMGKSTEEVKLDLVRQKLSDEIGTIFRQVAAYKFEQEVHKVAADKGYLSKGEIGKIFVKHMSAYMGPAVEQDQHADLWWVYWAHFRTPFYVYSYASGLLISKSLQAMVRENAKSIEKVKKFLSAGSSKSPKEIFAEMDIDITDPAFWQKGLNESRKLLKEFKKLTAK